MSETGPTAKSRPGPETSDAGCRSGAGFALTAERNRHDFALAFFSDMRAKTAAAGGPPPFGLHILMGMSAPEKVQNMIDNISKGRIAPVELIARKL